MGWKKRKKPKPFIPTGPHNGFHSKTLGDLMLKLAPIFDAYKRRHDAEAAEDERAWRNALQREEVKR